MFMVVEFILLYPKKEGEDVWPAKEALVIPGACLNLKVDFGWIKILLGSSQILVLMDQLSQWQMFSLTRNCERVTLLKK